MEETKKQELVLTSTNDRIKLAKELELDYDVTTEEIYIPELNGWKVKTTLVIYGKDETKRNKVFQSSAFREIDDTIPYTALETADTVSLGRCFGKMGIGIDNGFATSDEVSDQVIDITTKPKKKYPAHIKKEIEVNGKTVVIDTKNPSMTQTQSIEAKMALADGDDVKAQEIIEKSIDDTFANLDMPNRNLTSSEFKLWWNKMKNLGATIEFLHKFLNDNNIEFVGIKTEDVKYSNFFKVATDEQIKQFIETLKLTIKQ
jgi:hypothetical protein